MAEVTLSSVFSHRVAIIGDIGKEKIHLLEDQTYLAKTFPILSDANIQKFDFIADFESECGSDELNAISQTVAILGKEITAHSNNRPAQSVFYIACHDSCDADVTLAGEYTEKSLLSAISMGFEILTNRSQLQAMSEEIATVTEERKELSSIGVALSAEKDLDKLLTKVLDEGRKLGNCEAASLYLLLNPKSENPELLFKLTQNSEMEFDFQEMRFPLTNTSLAGYVALTGEILNIADAHHLSDDAPYHFDKSFDHKTGYRTRQMLVLPMRNHQRKIIGVLQFINNKDSGMVLDDELGFTQEREELLFSLASQAAVAIDNSQLIENIQSLFEGFVAASVKAIESRDPVTSGHSFRVAEYTTGLAEVLDRAPDGMYKDTFFSKQQLREIRYASLLHDFGKVGVKENVLLKANKLEDERLHYLELKIEWQKQFLQRQFYQKLLASGKSFDPSGWEGTDEYFQMQQKLEQLTNYQKVLMQANRPSILEAEVADELKQLFDYQLDDTFPHQKSLLSESDFLALSVTKGSLTNEERIEIQSHVVHTQEFLMAIPWTDELSEVPFIAGAHHEKLDGTGYPCGIKEDDIPVASRIMAVADIYDALTARDRPYKKAVKTDLAIKILLDEAKNNKLCQVMVDTFIEAKVYQKIHKD